MGKTRNKAFAVFLLSFLFLTQLCKAQESADNIELLKQNIKQGKTAEETRPQLKELANLCIKENKFDELQNTIQQQEKLIEDLEKEKAVLATENRTLGIQLSEAQSKMAKWKQMTEKC